MIIRKEPRNRLKQAGIIYNKRYHCFISYDGRSGKKGLKNVAFIALNFVDVVSSSSGLKALPTRFREQNSGTT